MVTVLVLLETEGRSINAMTEKLAQMEGIPIPSPLDGIEPVEPNLERTAQMLYSKMLA